QSLLCCLDGEEEEEHQNLSQVAKGRKKRTFFAAPLCTKRRSDKLNEKARSRQRARLEGCLSAYSPGLKKLTNWVSRENGPAESTTRAWYPGHLAAAGSSCQMMWGTGSETRYEGMYVE
ncbi:unnamed protein product, partial [Protopolystoma xenopodis]